MNGNFLYPVNISLAAKKCLIFGFGKVGRRKLAGLLSARPASILILDLQGKNIDPSVAAKALESHICLQIEQRSWEEEDIKGMFMVFACSSDKRENSVLAELCNRKNILCDNASSPEEGNFILPAVARSGSLLATIGTGGASPLLASRLKVELQDWLQLKSGLTFFLGKLRSTLLQKKLPHEENLRIFSSLLDSSLEEWLADGKNEACKAWLLENIPNLSQSELEEILGDPKNANAI